MTVSTISNRWAPWRRGQLGLHALPRFLTFLAALGLLSAGLSGCGGGAEKPTWKRGEVTPPEIAPKVEMPPSRATPSSGGSGELQLPIGYPTGPDHYLGEGLSPAPYTAAQIREACPPGRMNRFKMTRPEGKFITVQRFVETTEDGAKIQAVIGRRNWDDPRRDPPTQSEELIRTWTELQSHSSYPADQTKISRDRVRVEAGEYDCWKIQVEEGLTTTYYWFAVHLAGPPVLTEVFRGQDRLLTMELVAITMN